VAQCTLKKSREGARGGNRRQTQKVRGLRPEETKLWATVGWEEATVVRRLCSQGGDRQEEGCSKETEGGCEEGCVCLEEEMSRVHLPYENDGAFVRAGV
jgi:hypothetical protein